MIEFLSPTVLFFLIVILGTLLGRIKVSGVSLDLSAVLILAIIAGAIISFSFGESQNSYIDSLRSDMSFLSSLGTSLFVAAIGISAGYAITNRFKLKDLLLIFAGMLMVCVGFGVLILIMCFDKSMDISVLCGVLCGALTSTPGLSLMCEAENINSTSATLGYGYAYVFGVVFVVIFVQLLSRRIATENLSNEDSRQDKVKDNHLTSIMSIFVTAAIGTVIGKLTLPKINFSLGTSGGILCAGILVGVIVKRLGNRVSLNQDIISVIRSLGLMFFFVGSGVPAGMSMTKQFDIKWIFYGCIMTVAPVIIFWFLCSFVTHIDAKGKACLISGGMTSTPAIGVLINKSPDMPMQVYSLTYFGALLAMVVVSRIFVLFV